MLRGASALVKLFVRVRLIRVCRRVKPVENIPKKIYSALNRRGQAFRDWRGVHPETAFAFVAAFAPLDKRGCGLAGDGFRQLAECLLEVLREAAAGLFGSRFVLLAMRGIFGPRDFFNPLGDQRWRWG